MGSTSYQTILLPDLTMGSTSYQTYCYRIWLWVARLIRQYCYRTWLWVVRLIRNRNWFSFAITIIRFGFYGSELLLFLVFFVVFCFCFCFYLSSFSVLCPMLSTFLDCLSFLDCLLLVPRRFSLTFIKSGINSVTNFRGIHYIGPAW